MGLSDDIDELDAPSTRDESEIARSDQQAPDSLADIGAQTSKTHTFGSVWSSIELGHEIDEETNISVEGFRYDGGDDGGVDIMISAKGALFSIWLSPDRAREFGESLLEVADHAKNGVVEN